jgi:uncharacterized protein with von Willebrand factor type A (vWA) domain
MFEQDFNQNSDHMNTASTGHEHGDLFQTDSKSITSHGETFFHKVSNQVNNVLQGVSDLIDAPSRLANSIQEIW